MLQDNERISPSQLTAVLVLSIGVAKVMAGPRYLAKDAGPDGWISILAGSLVAFGAAWIMGNLARLFPREDIIGYAPRIVGRWLGVLVGLFFAVFWILMAAREIRVLGDLVETYMLERTPIEVVMFTMLLACGYLARNGLEPIARVSQILLPVIVIPLVLLLVATWNQADLSNLKPIMEKGPWPAAKGALDVLGRFNGLEAMLVLIPALAYRSRHPKSAYSAVLVTLFIQLVAFISVAANVGPTQAGRFTFPTLTVIQGLRLPSLFFERVTNIAVALWIASLYASLSAILYLIALAISRLSGLRETRHFILPLTVVVFLVSMVPSNLTAVVRASAYFWIVSLFAIIVLPLALYLIARIRGFKRPSNGGNADDSDRGPGQHGSQGTGEPGNRKGAGR